MLTAGGSLAKTSESRVVQRTAEPFEHLICESRACGYTVSLRRAWLDELPYWALTPMRSGDSGQGQDFDVRWLELADHISRVESSDRLSVSIIGLDRIDHITPISRVSKDRLSIGTLRIPCYAY